MREIVVTIDKETWEISLNAFNYVGKECQIDLDTIASLLNGITIEQSPKPEIFYKESIELTNRAKKR